MGMSAAHCQGNVGEFQSVSRVVTLSISGHFNVFSQASVLCVMNSVSYHVMCRSVDYSILLSIVDESLTSPRDKLKCMLFAPDIHSLPDANVGDIIRFHRLKVSAGDCYICSFFP